MRIMQGTTPTLQIKISTSDFLVSDITGVDFMIKNSKLQIYGIEDLTVDTENNAIIKSFSAEETAALDPSKNIVVQALFHFADGSAVGIEKITLSVADMLGVGT